jgi:ABC-2 type transport system permease protein
MLICSRRIDNGGYPMNIYLRELRAHRNPLIAWSVGMLFMIIGGMAKYATYYEAGQNMTDIINKIPPTIRAILGFGDFDVSKASGFYGLLFLYLVLMATIHASMLGAEMISKEERDKTTEFLLVKPVSRNRIITFKLLAAFTNILILNIVTMVLSISIFDKYSHGEDINNDIYIMMIGLFIMQVLFLFIGSAIAAFSKNPKTSTSATTSVLLLTFMLSIIMDMNSHLSFLKYFTPFKYFTAQGMMYGGGLDPVFVILSLMIIAVTCTATYVFFKKRDMRI